MTDLYALAPDDECEVPLPPVTPPDWIDEPPLEKSYVPGRALSSSQALTAFNADLAKRKAGHTVGLPWPPEWSALGGRLGPLEPGSLTVIGARPSVGKTMMGMQLARFHASKGVRVVYVSRELSVVRLVRRHICSYGADMYRLRTGKLNEQDEQAIATYEKESRRWIIFYDDLATTIEEVKAGVLLYEPGVIIIDYLQRFAYDTEKEYAAITRIVNELQDLTLATDIPVVCLSQLSRPMKGTEMKAPHMSDTRGSGAVEERAANLILLHRRWDTEQEERYGKQIEVAKSQSSDGWFLVEKCADGEVGHPISVRFNGPRFTITESL